MLDRGHQVIFERCKIILQFGAQGENRKGVLTQGNTFGMCV
jgi:hypothetical protein